MNRNARGQFVTTQQAAANKRAEAVAYVLEEAVAEAVRLLKRGVYRENVAARARAVDHVTRVEADHRHLAERALLDGARAAELLIGRAES